MRLMVGEVLSKYRILEEIGQGGMATVYRGMDMSLQREVAVKVLHAHLANREESRERFCREAHAVARLRHDNILEIYDYSGKDSERNFIVMEFIHGPTLKDFLDGFTLNVPEIGAMITAEVCRALAHAHSTGIIHRDIKPENIMIRDDGLIKLTDFGIASMVDTQKLTVTGQLLGSPAFMAPEMVTGDRLDFRTDVFAVGILLYRLTVGELPFKGKNPHEVLKRIAEADFIRPIIANPRVGDELSAIILRSLRRDPEERYSSVESLMTALCAHLDSLHLGEPRAVLREFFAAPAAYQSELERQLVQGLLEAGRAQMRGGSHARAFSHLNRVLAFDPHHPEVKVHLGRLGRRRSIFALARATLLAVTIIGAGAAVAWGVGQMRGGTPAGGALWAFDAESESFATDAEFLDADPVDAMPSPDSERALPPRDAALPPRDGTARVPPVGGPRRVAPSTRRFVLRVSPPVWTLHINGQKVSSVPGTPAEVELGPGEHVLSFRDDRMRNRPWTFHVGSDTPGQVLDRQMAWHPARLELTGSPAEARWQFLAPAYLARLSPRPLGGPYPIRILHPQESGVSARIRVYRNGYESVEKQVFLRPNEDTRLEINLQPLR